MRVNNVGRLRAKAVPKIGKEFVKEVKREQFNSIINSDLATEVKVMAQRLGVPGYALVEHLFQIGCYCLVKAEQDPASLETIREHLVSHHLLGVAEPEDVRLLSLGQPDPSEWLEHDMLNVIRAFKDYDDWMFGKRTCSPEEHMRRLLYLRREWWKAVNELRHNFEGLRKDEPNKSKTAAENGDSTDAVETEETDEGDEDVDDEKDSMTDEI